MSDVILVQHDETESGAIVSTVTVNRPDKLNALNRDVLEGLHEALGAVREAGARCMILTGAGKAFVAGADIAAMQSMTPDQARDFSELGHRVGHAMESQPYPIVAAINGFALGGGCELALACDFAYASTKAKLGQPETKLGVIPGFGGTQRLLRRVGIAMARELVYTGKMIDAAEALRIGLVNGVYEPDELMGAVREAADRIVANGPWSIELAKKVLLEGRDESLVEANRLEATAFGRCFESPQQKEGMSAFLEKRAAKFE